MKVKYLKIEYQGKLIEVPFYDNKFLVINKTIKYMVMYAGGTVGGYGCGLCDLREAKGESCFFAGNGTSSCPAARYVCYFKNISGGL